MLLLKFSTDANVGNVGISWQRAFHEEDKSPRNEGGDVLALSAFMLSSLPTSVTRKQMVKEMWESGADTMVSSWPYNPLMHDLMDVGGLRSSLTMVLRLALSA